MRKIFIIGNLTADPVRRQTPTGTPLCTFTVAVNYKTGTAAKTDYYKVTAWRALGGSCAEYLHKGDRVSVIGDLSASADIGKDGKVYVSLQVSADEVEFITTRKTAEKAEAPAEPAPDPTLDGFADADDELPFS